MTVTDIQRPTKSLKDRVAIVTGAGGLPTGVGNGRAILLAEDGCSVVCVDLKSDLAQNTVDMIKTEGLGAALAVAGDVTKADDCKRIVEAALSAYGCLDILVNNVGITGPKGSAVEVDMLAAMKGLEVTVVSKVQMAKYAIPEMKKNEGQCVGSIVNMGGVAGLMGDHAQYLVPDE